MSLPQITINNNGQSFESDSTAGVIQVLNEHIGSLAESLQHDKPRSFPLLGALKCNELNEVSYKFYVDCWPNFDYCIAVIRSEYFGRLKKLQKQPYSIMHFFGRNDDMNSIKQFCRAVITAWHIPILFYPGASAKQMAAIADCLEQHGRVHFQEHVFRLAFSTSKSDIKTKTIPVGYEFVDLTANDADVVAENWGYTKAPYEVEDLRTLMERFRFYGIRHKLDGMLIAQYGQLHNGACGVGWVHPQHRNHKLFQALVSKGAASVIDRYGFAFAGVLKDNIPSWRAHLAAGLRGQDDHYVRWCQFIPHGKRRMSLIESSTELVYEKAKAV